MKFCTDTSTFAITCSIFDIHQRVQGCLESRHRRMRVNVSGWLPRLQQAQYVDAAARRVFRLPTAAHRKRRAAASTTHATNVDTHAPAAGFREKWFCCKIILCKMNCRNSFLSSVGYWICIISSACAVVRAFSARQLLVAANAIIAVA